MCVCKTAERWAKKIGVVIAINPNLLANMAKMIFIFYNTNLSLNLFTNLVKSLRCDEVLSTAFRLIIWTLIAIKNVKNF